MAALYEQVCLEISQDKIKGIAMDSRSIREDFLFCAASKNGQAYIQDAINRGAKRILTTPDYTEKHSEKEVKFLFYPEPRDIYHKICSFLWKRQPANVCAVTGTNGKTSVSYFFSQICALAGKKTASIGTIGVNSNIPEVQQHLRLTTPDAADLHKILDNLAQKEVEYCCLEASSQGIEQKRIDSVQLKAVAFSNLTHEHLDHHNSMEGYFHAKLRLFLEILPDDGIMILPTPNDYATKIKQSCPNKKIFTYGRNAGDIQLISQLPTQAGQTLTIKILGKEMTVSMKILGKFQGSNLMAAIGLALACGIDPFDIEYEKITVPAGRMEFIENPKQNCRVMIDYAHTPDGLQNLLLSLKWHFPYNDITLVFGCGGDRDAKKRPIMAQIATKMANKIIITDDNPRNESAEKIRHELMLYCPKAIEIAGRQHAIKYAISNGKPSEIIVITGRGPETQQIFKDRILQVSDAETIMEVVAAL